MDVKELKRLALIRGGIFSMVAICTISGVLLGEKFIDDINQQKEWLNNDVNSIRRKLEGLNQKTIEFTESIKIWDKMSDSSKQLLGLQINDAKDKLDSIKEIYTLPVLETVFSKPVDEDISGIKSDSVGIVSSQVSIKFEGLTDEDVFKFVNDLITSFPGYIEINNFTIARVADVTRDALRRVSLGNPPGLVRGKIDFTWRDLKKKSKEQKDIDNSRKDGRP